MVPSRGYALKTKCIKRHGIIKRHGQAFSIHFSVTLSSFLFLLLYSICSLLHLMASGWSTNVVSVTAWPFQYRLIGFLFSSIHFSLSLTLSFFILMSSLYCEAEIRRTVRCGEGQSGNLFGFGREWTQWDCRRSIGSFSGSPDDSCLPLSLVSCLASQKTGFDRSKRQHSLLSCWRRCLTGWSWRGEVTDLSQYKCSIASSLPSM